MEVLEAFEVMEATRRVLLLEVTRCVILEFRGCDISIGSFLVTVRHRQHQKVPLIIAGMVAGVPLITRGRDAKRRSLLSDALTGASEVRLRSIMHQVLTILKLD